MSGSRCTVVYAAQIALGGFEWNCSVQSDMHEWKVAKSIVFGTFVMHDVSLRHVPSQIRSWHALLLWYFLRLYGAQKWGCTEHFSCVAKCKQGPRWSYESCCLVLEYMMQKWDNTCMYHLWQFIHLKCNVRKQGHCECAYSVPCTFIVFLWVHWL